MSELVWRKDWRFGGWVGGGQMSNGSFSQPLFEQQRGGGAGTLLIIRKGYFQTQIEACADLDIVLWPKSFNKIDTINSRGLETEMNLSMLKWMENVLVSYNYLGMCATLILHRSLRLGFKMSDLWQ